MKIIVQNSEIEFNFKKYCNLMLGVVPKEDQIGLSEISFVNNFSHPKSEPDCLGCYLQGQNGRDASIEIHLPNIINNKISEFNFRRCP